MSYPYNNNPNMYNSGNDQATIHTRGSVRYNGYENASAGTGHYRDDGTMQGGQQSSARTNQRADLEGISRGMDQAYQRGDPDVRITSASQNVVDGINVYSKKWEANGYINSRNRPVQNQELYKEIKEKSSYFDNVSVEKISTNDEGSRQAYQNARGAGSGGNNDAAGGSYNKYGRY